MLIFLQVQTTENKVLESEHESHPNQSTYDFCPRIDPQAIIVLPD